MTAAALLIVDVQNDFFPGGALPVQTACQILPKLNHLLSKEFALIVATKDWHPNDHISFAAHHHKSPGAKIRLDTGKEQSLWPVHCVQHSWGAEFAPGWDTTKIDQIFYKGQNPNIDSYSAFFDNEQNQTTGLKEYLQQQGIDTVYIAGLATDYCVLYSALDAIKCGFKTFVIIDACQGVEVHPGDISHAFQMMKDAGVIF